MERSACVVGTSLSAEAVTDVEIDVREVKDWMSLFCGGISRNQDKTSFQGTNITSALVVLSLYFAVCYDSVLILTVTRA